MGVKHLSSLPGSAKLWGSQFARSSINLGAPRRERACVCACARLGTCFCFLEHSPTGNSRRMSLEPGVAGDGLLIAHELQWLTARLKAPFAAAHSPSKASGHGGLGGSHEMHFLIPPRAPQRMLHPRTHAPPFCWESCTDILTNPLSQA